MNSKKIQKFLPVLVFFMPIIGDIIPRRLIRLTFLVLPIIVSIPLIPQIKIFMRKHKFFNIFIFFLVSTMLTGYLVNDGSEGWYTLTKLLLPIGYYYLVIAYYIRYKSIVKLEYALILGIIVHVVFSLWRFISGYEMQYRLGGAFMSAELFAEYCAIIVILSFNKFLFSTKERIWLIALVLGVIAGIFTVTRGFLIGFPISLVILTILSRSKITKRSIFVLAIIVATTLYINTKNIEIIDTGVQRISKLEVAGDNAFNRGVIFSITLEAIKEMNYWGYGYTYMSNFSKYAHMTYNSPHSLYSTLILMAGVVGGILGILFLCLPVHMVIILRKHKNSKYRADYIGYLVVIAYFVVSQAKIEYLRDASYQIIIMMLLGVITVKINIIKAEGAQLRNLTRNR